MNAYGAELVLSEGAKGIAGAIEKAEELARATRSQVVQVIGTKFVLYRETHSKPRDKRIKLVK